LGRKHIYLPHAQTAIYDSKVKLFLKQGISHQLGRDMRIAIFRASICLSHASPGLHFFPSLQGFQSGPVSGTFTRLRSCIVPAEITEPPKISGGQNF
jgi:hypothetical protein